MGEGSASVVETRSLGLLQTCSWLDRTTPSLCLGNLPALGWRVVLASRSKVAVILPPPRLLWAHEPHQMPSSGSMHASGAGCCVSCDLVEKRGMDAQQIRGRTGSARFRYIRWTPKCSLYPAILLLSISTSSFIHSFKGVVGLRCDTVPIYREH